MTGVVGAPEREAVGISVRLHGVAAVDGDVLPADALIAAGARVAKRAERCLDQQVSALADRDAVRSPVGEPDLAQVSAGLDAKLVLERSSLAPEDEVDSGPDVAVSELAVGRKVAVMLGADQVVDLAGRPLACHEPRARARTERREMERDSLLLLGEGEDSLVRREVEGVARRLGRSSARSCRSGLCLERTRAEACRTPAQLLRSGLRVESASGRSAGSERAGTSLETEAEPPRTNSPATASASSAKSAKQTCNPLCENPYGAP